MVVLSTQPHVVCVYVRNCAELRCMCRIYNSVFISVFIYLFFFVALSFENKLCTIVGSCTYWISIAHTPSRRVGRNGHRVGHRVDHRVGRRGGHRVCRRGGHSVSHRVGGIVSHRGGTSCLSIGSTRGRGGGGRFYAQLATNLWGE